MKAVSIALVSCLLVSCDEPSEAQPEPSEAATTQAAETASPLPPPSPLETFTDVSAEDLAAALRAAPGRVLLVNLWSTWCRPCMEEMPQLVSMAERHRDAGLGTMFISMDTSGTRADALRFMVEQNAPSPSYIRVGRDADFIPAMHEDWSGTLPATILFNQSRQPQHVWVGEAPMDELERAVQRMLSERNE